MMGPLAPFESKSASISEYEGSLALFNRLDMSTIVCCGDKIYVGWKESINVYKKFSYITAIILRCHQLNASKKWFLAQALGA